jgi:RNA polymerase sigma-70 factor (ECF subfamily)
MEESQAVARLKRGDIGGLEALVRKYQVQATRAADLIVRDRALADDIVQTAFLRAYERIEQFDAKRPFAPWFLRMVINDAIKTANKRKHYVSLETRIEDELRLADWLTDPGPDPLDSAQRAEMSEAVWAAIGKLTPAQRAAIVQHYFPGLSEAEVASKAPTSAGTIRWRLHVAKVRLRALLNPIWSPQSGVERER